jgi:hypothetical protein
MVRGFCVAADKDQARLLLDKISMFLALCPALAKVLVVTNWVVRNIHTGSELTVLSSDAATSFGITPDFVICDELTHWAIGNGEALWQSLASSAAKRRNCLFLIITNAGFVNSWQLAAREAFRANPDCYFHELDGPCASWITPDRLAEQQRLLPAPAYARLWLNQWSTGSSDLLADAEIEAAITLDGPTERERQVKYLGGLDLGLSKNSAAFVIVGKLGTRCKLVRAWEWKPPRGAKVSIDEIEATIIRAHKVYSLTGIACDPWQSAQLVERGRKQNVPIRERAQSGRNLVEQAAALLAGFNDHSLDLFDYEPLLRDLRQARLEEKSYGVRIVSPEVNGGHGDVLTAFTIALAEARGVIVRSGEPWGSFGTRPIAPATTMRGIMPSDGGGSSMYGEGAYPGVYRPGGKPSGFFF